MEQNHKLYYAKWGLIWFCVVAIAVSFAISKAENSGQDTRITKIESPCQRYGSESKICQEAFETAVKSINHRIACYIDRKAGKPFKPSCKGVRLRIEDAEPAKGGDAESTPNQGTSLPGPAETGPAEHSGSAPPEPPAEAPEPANPPLDLKPTLEGVTETVCSVNALGITICN